MSHECCESCRQDIEMGYGEDLIDMNVCCCCCCLMEREEGAGCEPAPS